MTATSAADTPTQRFDAATRATLLELARTSIAHGLRHGRPRSVQPADHPELLRAPGACFVTLHRHGQLRGCIGSLEARRPLVEDVVSNAYAAAFRDPRFPPLAEAEFADLELHLSVLSPSEPMTFRSESDLRDQLRPGIDGVILESAGQRGTFLPSVWEQLPSRAEFLVHLKRKAGLPQDAWPADLRAWRYTTESFG